MKKKPDPAIAIELPPQIPVLVLPGALILPQAMLTINAAEDGEKDLIETAFKSGRLLGILQPKDKSNDPETPFFSVGGAGRIVSFSETDEGVFLIGLTGVCRFKIKTYTSMAPDSLLAEVDWTPFYTDLTLDEEPFSIDRERLNAAMSASFKKEGLMLDWQNLQTASDESLISVLSIACPLSITEKQALLECVTLKERSELLIALLEMSVHKSGAENRQH